MQPIYEMYLYKTTPESITKFDKVLQLEKYTDLLKINKWVDTSTLEVQLPVNSDQGQQFIAAITDENVISRYIIVFKNIEDTEDNFICRDWSINEVNGLITFKANESIELLNKFISYPADGAYDIRTNTVPITQAIKELITNAVISPVKARDLPIESTLIQIETAVDFGDNIRIFSRFKNIGEEIKVLLAENDINIKVRFDDESDKPFIIIFKQGLDLSEEVELSKVNKSLSYENIHYDSNELNTLAYCLGQGEGALREIQSFKNPDVDPFQYNEVTVDARDVDIGDAPTLLQRAEEKARLESQFIDYFTEINGEGKTFVLGVDYNLGDVVTFKGSIFTLTVRIVEIAYSWSSQELEKISIAVKELTRDFNDSRIEVLENSK